MIQWLILLCQLRGLLMSKWNALYILFYKKDKQTEHLSCCCLWGRITIWSQTYLFVHAYVCDYIITFLFNIIASSLQMKSNICCITWSCRQRGECVLETPYHSFLLRLSSLFPQPPVHPFLPLSSLDILLSSVLLLPPPILLSPRTVGSMHPVPSAQADLLTVLTS